MVTQTPLAPFIGDRSPRILAVDDQPVNLQVLAAHLTRWGCTVQTAANGDEALGEATSFEPDVILLDVMMPGQSGFEVLRSLRADPATRHIPVIFLTALAAEESKVMGLETGARDYVTKPFNVAELAARVGARLREKYAEDALRAQQAELSTELPTDPLTGLLTRHGFEQAATRALAESPHSDLPVSLLVIDIDDFARLNERDSREAGDRALRSVAESILASRRSTDVTGRWGSDDFSWLLPTTADPEARVLAETVRNRHGVSGPTISVGGVTMFSSGPDGSPVAVETLIARAGEGLARAKRAGGNKVLWA